MPKFNLGTRATLGLKRDRNAQEGCRNGGGILARAFPILVPKLDLGTHAISEAELLLPPVIAAEQSYRSGQPFVRGCISPMLRGSDKTALHRIIMQIFQFLQHDLICRNRLRVKALLPNLILILFLVRSTMVPQLVQEAFGFLLLQ